MSIQSFTPRAQANWDLNLPVGGTQPVAPAAPAAPTAPVQPQAPQQGNPWENWSAKGQLFDYGYDAYMFSKFPLNVGGPSFWTGGGLRMKMASMFSKIPQERLIVLAVREQFMKVQGMTPDHARVLQMAYYNHLNSDPTLRNTPPLNWLAQYGAGGTMNDWLLRGPLIVEMNLIAGQVALEQGWAPDVPGNGTLTKYGASALSLLPPAVPSAPVAPKS
jgi:hypothetical protein